MAEWMETHRAVVFPWHCDHLGHMNVRWYAHFFDDAGFHLWMKAGLSPATLKQRGIVAVVARTETDFLSEATAGQLLMIESAFTGLGNKSLTYTQKMSNAETGKPVARQKSVEVCFDIEARKAAPMPDDIRARIEAVLVAEE